MTRFILLIICLLQVSLNGYSQSYEKLVDSDSLTIKFWTIEDGLPINTVNQVVQDDDGYLWFTSYDGIIRFDGVEFKTFNHANTPEIPHNRATEIHKQNGVGIWVSMEHDEVGSGLSGIALSGDILSTKLELEENGNTEQLKKITNNARALASSLDSIVWMIDANKETLQDFITKCRSVSKELLIHHQVEFIVTIPEDKRSLSLNASKKRHLFLLLKESLNNILKHANGQAYLASDGGLFSFLNNTLRRSLNLDHPCFHNDVQLFQFDES